MTEMTTEVELVGRRLARINKTRAAVVDQMKAVVKSAAEQGVSEAEIARQAGVDRMTIRSWLGKR